MRSTFLQTRIVLLSLLAIGEIIELDVDDDEMVDGSHGSGNRGWFRMTPSCMFVFYLANS